MLQLPDVPVRVEKAQIDDADVPPDPFNILEVPQREGVVITVCEEDAVLVAALKQVVGIIPRHIVAGSVCLVVVHPRHIDRGDEKS